MIAPRPGHGEAFPAGDGGPRAISYGVIAPPLWALVGIMAGELLVMHPLLAQWTPRGALATSALSLAVVGWLTFGLLSMPWLPVQISRDQLVMRAGRLKGARVPMVQGHGLRREWDSAAPKRRDVLNLALVSHPDALVDLTAPLPGRRGVTAIAHRLDDPAGFAAALEAARTSLGIKSIS